MTSKLSIITDASIPDAADQHAPLSARDEMLRQFHPGMTLKHDFMAPLGLTQQALAGETGLPQGRLSEICRGRRAVTAETALRLAERFGTSPEFWMNLQVHYDLEVARDRRLAG